ncbi:MAG: hypothetical protein LPD71_04760 [Shewanella sp.]|nr:hypothetical protein [Shewanella sp.]MCF1431854.1 hypothetical protein [Shewanella sp.]MCF1438074.1 hypothetical protein [Shewanella sp.]MCF1457989.1 hypothetical protein [Shewanella sp.]
MTKLFKQILIFITLLLTANSCLAVAIPPESTLIFEIELVKVEAQKDKPAMMGMGSMGSIH